ncbi:MAG: GPW/gp25 family protein [Propylenella sp.]
MATRLDLMGKDLKLDYALGGGFFEDADLATALDDKRIPRLRDLLTTDRVGAIEQAIVNRLKTRKGELALLGHANYGSRHHELIGEPNVERVRNLIKLYVMQALRDEPRIESLLKVDVRPDHDPPRETVRIVINARLIGEQTPLNLVVPFSLETGA